MKPKQAPKRCRHTLVVVHWLDADSDGGWSSGNEDESVELVKSVGILVGRGKHFISIAMAHNRESGDWLGRHRIPIGMVRKVETLKRGFEC